MPELTRDHQQFNFALQSNSRDKKQLKDICCDGTKIVIQKVFEVNDFCA